MVEHCYLKPLSWLGRGVEAVWLVVEQSCLLVPATAIQQDGDGYALTLAGHTMPLPASARCIEALAPISDENFSIVLLAWKLRPEEEIIDVWQETEGFTGDWMEYEPRVEDGLVSLVSIEWDRVVHVTPKIPVRVGMHPECRRASGRYVWVWCPDEV